MKLPPFPFVVLDTETTGFVPRVHKVIEFASTMVRDGQVASEYETLCAIEGEIPPHVEVLTRIRTADLGGKPAFSASLPDIEAHLEEDALIVGQNVGFDIGMLKGEGLDLSERPRLDTSMLASLVFPECRSFSLGYLSDVLGLPHAPRHRALGDVRATTALLGHCWERLCSLPKTHLAQAKDILGRSTPGYRMLAAALPDGTEGPVPDWLKRGRPAPERAEVTPRPLTCPEPGTVELREESLDPTTLAQILAAAGAQAERRHWIAVKNIELLLRQVALSAGVAILYPPFLLLDPEAKDRLLAQETFTADEATLALKLLWYAPRTRADLPIHGDERAVWNGKLACTETSPAYAAQFADLPGAVVIDHQQLLAFLADPAHAAHGALREGAHVVIDDASMLEDTATKAYGQRCSLDDLRAAAEGKEDLTRFTDLAFLLAEKLGGEDIRYLTDSDLARPETKGLRELLGQLLEDASLPGKTREMLTQLREILHPSVHERIAWLERRRGGGVTLHSAPEFPEHLLQQHLFSAYGTTLLVPPGLEDNLPGTLPPKTPTTATPLPEDPSELLAIGFGEEKTLQAMLEEPPEGKTIFLLSSKRSIEMMFIKFMEKMEAKGVTMLCQGMSGGQGRMEAEFLSAQGKTVWLLTPWTYEGTDLPRGSVDHLVLESLPFDHPNHAVLSRRALHFKNAFMQYFVPRLQHRLFRLLRTFRRHARDGGDVCVLDQRLFSKDYGRAVRGYLSRFAAEEKTDCGPEPKDTPEPKKQPTKKNATPKKDEGQLQLF